MEMFWGKGKFGNRWHIQIIAVWKEGWRHLEEERVGRCLESFWEMRLEGGRCLEEDGDYQWRSRHFGRQQDGIWNEGWRNLWWGRRCLVEVREMCEIMFSLSHINSISIPSVFHQSSFRMLAPDSFIPLDLTNFLLPFPDKRWNSLWVNSTRRKRCAYPCRWESVRPPVELFSLCVFLCIHNV